MTSGEEPLIDRESARLLILDQTDRLLLFRATNDEEPGPFWFTPGGGVEPGESYEDAARRELWEETGQAGLEIGPWVWHRDLRYLGHRFLERYFVVRSTEFEPKPAKQDPHFEQYMSEPGWFRWWSHAEIVGHDVREPLYPPRLAELLQPLLDGRLLAEPIELSE